MALELTDVHPVLLSGSHSGTTLAFTHETSPLASYDDELLLVLEEEEEVQMRVSDFTEGTTTYNVYAWTIESDDSLTAWTRSGGISSSATVSVGDLPSSGDFIADFVAMDVVDGSSAPAPTSGTNAQQQGGKKIKVKIRKGDIRPIPSISEV